MLYSVLVSFRPGQNLANLYKRIRARLQEAMIAEADSLSSKERTVIEVLMTKFTTSAPFRPLDIFDVNFASAASLLGLILTYVIVLLQFKVSDKSSVSVSAGNVTAT